jgi:hypothetical protein
MGSLPSLSLSRSISLQLYSKRRTGSLERFEDEVSLVDVPAGL